MSLLPDFDYTDYNVVTYEETETKPSELKKEWYYPLVWLAMLIIIIMAWIK